MATNKKGNGKALTSLFENIEKYKFEQQIGGLDVFGPFSYKLSPFL